MEVVSKENVSKGALPTAAAVTAHRGSGHCPPWQRSDAPLMEVVFKENVSKGALPTAAAAKRREGR